MAMRDVLFKKSPKSGSWIPSTDSPSARPGAGPPDQELRQQGDRTTGGTLGVTRHRGGSGNVQVCPLVRLGEAGEEAGRGDRTRGAPTEVGHVGEVALELALVLVPQRQLPGAVTRLDTAREQFGGEPVVVGEETAGVTAEGNYTGASEGGDVNHAGRLEALGVGQGVAQYEAAFGVGVEDLDALTGHRDDDVARAAGVTARHVLNRR